MTNHISTVLRSICYGSIAAFGCVGITTVASAQSACIGRSADLSVRNEVNAALMAFGSRLVAVGRVDTVAPSFGAEVLGFRVQPTAGDSLQVGDYAVVIDWTPRGSKERVLEVRSLATRYVPGASEVYVKSAISAADVLRGRVRLGPVVVDHSASILSTRGALSVKGAMFAVRGTQPAPLGVVLGACASVSAAEGSLGTGSPDGSMGTGSPDGSMGTGSPDGSMGTGSPDGSMGTGRPDGSMGTGSSAG